MLTFLRPMLVGSIGVGLVLAPLTSAAASSVPAVDEVDKGRIVFACVPSEQHHHTIGIRHGGLAATLLDSAMGCAVHSLLAPASNTPRSRSG